MKKPIVGFDALVMGEGAKVYLEEGEELHSVERSWVSVKGHPDPLMAIVTKANTGEVRAFWTCRDWARMHPTRRFSMLRFNSVEEALSHTKNAHPQDWFGAQAPETYSINKAIPCN